MFNYEEISSVGKVQSVDTTSVIIGITESQMLSKLQVNHLVVIRSKHGQHLIGLVEKIVRKFDAELESTESACVSNDVVKVVLIGTFLDKEGESRSVFKRTLQSVPEIDADCFVMSDELLSQFMTAISQGSANVDNPLCIGHYTLNDDAPAWLDGNKFFQRHAVIAGSTGSGKSYTVARLIEQVAKLKSCNALLFDIHGEYTPLTGGPIKRYKIAGPSDTDTEGVLFLPYWLLTYEEMLSMMLDRSDNNAPNQAMVFSRAVIDEKRRLLKENGETEYLDSFTIDSPVPYDLKLLLESLHEIDKEMVEGSRGPKQGDFFGKLSRFIQRLESKISDKRLNFMFAENTNFLTTEYMNRLCHILLESAAAGGGVKIIDFSEVPSDILPLIVSLIARLVFTIQQWSNLEKRHPIALFCDEAHLYIPANIGQGTEQASVQNFERIAKEGRKYGVGLVVISQRPSEVNRTVLSQSSNFIAMRLTNADDQNVVQKLLPDNLGNFASLLPILDIGEALVVGDASLLPSRIKITPPDKKPNSATVKFWDEWSKDVVDNCIDEAIDCLRKQSK